MPIPGPFDDIDAGNPGKNPPNQQIPTGGKGGIPVTDETREIFDNLFGGYKESARQLPDYQIPLHGIDTSLIPGFQEMEPYNFDEWYQRIFGGGTGGGRVGGQSNPASDFLNGLFGGGIEDVGQLNPNFINNIGALQGAGLSNNERFNQELSQLGSQYNSQISGVGNDLISFLMGESGGRSGGGGGLRFSSGGGGGISSQGIEGILASLPEFQAREIRTALPELDPQLANELDTIKQAQLADFERLREEQNSELLTRLFGRGVQQSTVAGEAAARANEGLERTRLQVLSEDINRRLGIREGEAERILQGDLGSLSAEAGAYGDRLRSLTGIRSSELGAEASAAGARASAAASSNAARAGLEGDRLRALASIYGSQVGGLQSLFGSQTGAMASGFGTQQGTISNFADLYGNLALGNQQADINKFLGLGDIAGGVLSTQAQERAAARNSRVQQQQNQLGFLGFMEDVAGRFQQGLMGQESFDLQRELAQLQGDVSRYNARRAEAAGGGGFDWGQLISSAAIAYAAFASDERVKTDVRDYDGVSITPEKVQQLHPIVFRYIHDPESIHSGVMAQELENIFPDLVIEDVNGIKMVNYPALTAMLLKGYRDFVEEVA